MEGNITTMFPNITTPPSEPEKTPLYVGFICASLAVVLYGTTYIPVKKYDTGDGMFFQWMFGISIGIYSLIVAQVRGNPTFYPLTMLGGALFITGNLTVVPIVKLIGLGLGFSIWGVTNLLSGWATGRFGLFGLKADPPDNLVLNDIGVILAVISAVIFTAVKNEVSSSNIDTTVTVDVSENSPLLRNTDHLIEKRLLEDPECDVITIPTSIQAPEEESLEPQNDSSLFDRLSPTVKRVLGIVLSLIAGLIYGQCFTPFLYVQNNYEHSSQNALDYVFSSLIGSLLSSTVYFLLYAAYMKNRPKVYPRVILPAFISGLLWTGGTTCWFVANKVLSESVAFPIVTTGPAVVANLLAVFVFKEIKGFRNLTILVIGMGITITGAILAGFSKQSSSG
ncbi:transmembrane protein 144-like isoform X2 [Ruditapes philippinarum]|nr:transmembrane protein 144-like isoform X2 [Ruditapes philippinarum]XP_060596388.1 transmembrane protein 144-like isoform X2 [Ruditapes philippinarum]XP_060596389.1 transmembrane protein 144-like isoform X2 [Ruditapes philippinarum]